MANNPRVKLEADLSSFQAELNKLMSTIGQMGDKLKTESGKTDFNFKGTQKELDTLVKLADKLTIALEKGDKKSAQYAKNLKAMQEGLEKAAKVAAKLEDVGTAKSARVSGYFRSYAGEIGSEASDVAGRMARERELAKRDAEMHAQNAKWAGRAARFAGFVGGSMIGGGGGYSQMGAGLGSMFGPIGGAVGGVIGGAADRYASPLREEAKVYSELRRMVGSTVTDFSNLRDSVRSATRGFTVTDLEAANLAKTFAKTAGLSGDATYATARGVGTSVGFAQGYGVSNEQATSFFASMRLNGSTRNDSDNRRMALLIGESVAKGGTSAKMDEVLSVIGNFVSHATQQTLLAPNVGSYASLLSTGTGMGIAGLKSNPNGVASIFSAADSGVLSGGGRGEASQYQWLRARQNGIAGTSWNSNSLMQSAGLLTDLGGVFGPDSAAYQMAEKNGDYATMAEYQSLSRNASGKTNLGLGMARAKALSGGNSALEMQNIMGMFGINNPQHAAALQMIANSDKGLGGFERKLQGYGINVAGLNMSQVGSMADLVAGGSGAFSNQYKKLMTGKALSDAEKASMKGVMDKEGMGKNLEKMILDGTAKDSMDEGLKNQLTQIDLDREISRSLTSLVSIEGDARQILLGLLNSANPNNQITAGIGKRNLADIGISISGIDIYGKQAANSQMVADSVKKMRAAKTMEEKASIGDAMMAQIHAAGGEGYPSESMKILTDEKKSQILNQSLPASNDYNPTISRDVAPAMGGVAGMVKSKSSYDALFAEAGGKYGVDPMVLKQIAAQESGLNPLAIGDNGSSKDYGIMQHNSRYMGERGLDDSNWSDPKANVMAGAKLFSGLLKKSGGDYWKAFKMYNGSGSAAERYADNSMATYNAVHADQIQPSQRKHSQNPWSAKVGGTFRLIDSIGREVAEPISVSTSFGAPSYAGS